MLGGIYRSSQGGVADLGSERLYSEDSYHSGTNSGRERTAGRQRSCQPTGGSRLLGLPGSYLVSQVRRPVAWTSKWVSAHATVSTCVRRLVRFRAQGKPGRNPRRVLVSAPKAVH